MKADVTKDVKTLIENGLSFEKENKVEEAIQSYEKALNLHAFKKDNEIFELYIKVGDLYQIIGQIEKGLNYFQNAYNIAEILGNKEFQIDTLNKIADSYISNGEIEKCAKYAEMASNILNEVDYLKGRIENSICLSRIYYIKKEFFKAREICNEALKLCSDEFTFYKGRILITLGELYKDLTSVEEHLELLRQAYECFEKANYKRGMLGALNNIASVYSNKLQDHEKALEYLIKLKELSEDSIYVEFQKITSLNIGEFYLKCFKYDKALLSLQEALKMPFGAYMDNILVYNYALLSLSNLKLFNYGEAYDFFVKASEEVNKNSSAESTLAQYYLVAALMFVEFAENGKANFYIKQALDCVEKDETMIKWNIGLVYENIKLCEAFNEVSIIDILEGIRYTLSKYKNKDEKLDEVYNITIELINGGKYDLAFNFLNEYRSMNSENDSVILKKMYIDIIYNKIHNNEDIKTIELALVLAKQTNNLKIEWRLLSLIGDFYFKNNDFNNTTSYYSEALNIVRNLVQSVPEEYKLQFFNANNLIDPYNKIKIIKHNKNNEELYVCKTISSKKQLDEILNSFAT